MHLASKPVNGTPQRVHLVAHVDLEIPAQNHGPSTRRIERYDEWVVPGSREEAEFRQHLLTLAGSGWCRVHSTRIEVEDQPAHVVVKPN